MEQLFNLDNLVTLALLTLLQAVLGFDNLLYISLESQRVPANKQATVRRLGIGLAVVFRIALLFILMRLVTYFQDPIFGVHAEGLFEGEFNLHSLIVLLGGIFIIYTATKEVLHMMSLEDLAAENHKPRSVKLAVFWIVAMNLVFSFDSILSAMALSDVFWVMAAAIVVGGLLMIWLADSVSTFLQRNRMYEVLGLFVLFVVGIMLLSEGGHIAHVAILGQAMTPMSKATFYFIIAVLVLTEIVQTRYRQRLQKQKVRRGLEGAVG